MHNQVTSERKTLLSAELFGAYPVLLKPDDYIVYKERDGKMQESREYFNYGYAIFYARNINKRFSMGLEFTSRQFLAPSPTFDTVVYASGVSNFVYDTLFLKAENLNMLTRGLMLRFEFHGKKGLGPIGLTHLAGIGYNTTRLQKKLLQVFFE